MARMDGAEVERGDTVFDFVYGAGTVVGLYPDERVAVRFGNGRELVYDATTGTSNRLQARTLFWSQPFLIPPPKNRSDYSKYQQAAQALADVLI